MFYDSRVAVVLLAFVHFATAAPSRETRSKVLPRDLLGANRGLPTTNTTFDYVIIGRGNAGLTLAGRLSEDPSTRVAVIEA